MTNHFPLTAAPVEEPRYWLTPKGHAALAKAEAAHADTSQE